MSDTAETNQNIQEKIASVNPSEKELEPNKKSATLALIIILVLFVGMVVGVIFLANAEATLVSQVRDIFIILMALMLFIIGIALVVLIIQIAALTNLLNNEIRPILSSTTDTVNTLKGTVRFLSDNITEPVIKLNESLASIKKLGDVFRLKKQ